MKSLYTATLFLLFCSFLSAQQLYLPPTVEAPLYEHLYQINDAWYTQAGPSQLLEPHRFGNDQERIKLHLQLVEQDLRARPVDHLSAQQQARRTKVLNHLRSYWQAGQFPLNEQYPERIPIFVDEYNTACAVGYLMQHTGAREAVAQIRAENNFADLNELLAYEQVPAWVQTNGFTAEELAWIQPAYAIAVFTAEPFGNNQGISGGRVLDMLVHNNELYLAGTFESIDGFTAAKIAVWDGSDFRALPGLEADTPGGISRLAIDDTTGDIYAIGTFYAFPQASGAVVLVRYHDGNWEPLLEITDTGGETLTDIACRAGQCYISGSFDHLFDNPAFARLAVLQTNTQQWSALHSEWSFEGSINDLDIEADRLMVGGDYQLLEQTDTLAQHVAVVDLSTSTLIDAISINEDYPADRIHFVDISQNEFDWEYRMVLEDQYGLAFAYQEIGWHESLDYTGNTPEVFGISETWGFVYGLFPFNSGGPNPPYVLLTTPGQSASLYWPVAQANSAVTAVAEFEDELIVAGDFTEIDEEAINHLAVGDLRIVSNIDDPVPANDMKVRSDGQRIFLSQLPVPAENATLELFDMAGRKVSATQLSLLEPAQEWQPEGLPAGAYAYRLLVDEHLQVGQITLVR